MTSVAAVVAAGTAVLRDAGFTHEAATIDASVLARHLLGWSLADWLTHRESPATPGFADAFARLVHRRAAREPVAYLTGTREFYGRPFVVGPGVLIPRPETELLVEAACAAAACFGRPRVLDIGSGSGCVAVTIALECEEATVTSVDVSSVALDAARHNAAALGARIELVEADLFPAGGPWQVIVSNPPYVPSGEAAMLSRDVRDYEPATALFAGADGLDTIRRIVRLAPRHLSAGGCVCLEVGAGQQEAVTGLLADANFTDVTWRLDLQDIPRVVSGRLPV